MKKALLVLFFAFAAWPAAADYLTINPTFSGLNTDDNPATLTNGETADSENVLTDQGPSLEPRLGLVDFSTTTCSGGMWQFPHSDGTRYIICADGANLKASSGDGTFDLLISTIPTSVKIAVTALGDTLYFASTVDGIKSWDTSSVSVASATLTVSQLVTHKGCLWATGKASAARTVYKSAFGDGANWAIVADDPADTDPAVFVIGGKVDEPVTALYASFQGRLMWFKNTSFGGILGESRADFTPRVYSDNIGTAYPSSIIDCDGELRWLAGQRTIYGFNGAKLRKLSDGIDDLVGTVLQGDAESRVFVFTSQSDFNDGTNSQTTNALTAGSVLLSTWTDTDTSGADFNAGTTLTNVSTSTVAGSVYLVVTGGNTNPANNSFEDALGSEWTATKGAIDASQPQDGSYSYQGGTKSGYNCSTDPDNASYDWDVKYYVLDVNDNVLTSGTNDTSSSYQQFTISLSAYAGSVIKIRIVDVTESGEADKMDVKTAAFFCSGTSMTFYAKWYLRTISSTCGYRTAIDLFENGVSSIGSGTFLSQSLDTSLSSAAWLASGASWTTNGGAVSIKTQTSADNSSWSSLVDWTTGSAPSSPWRRYMRYEVTLTTTTSSTAVPYFDDATFSARQATGSWTSASIDTDGMSAYSVFEIQEALNSGTIVYTVYTDTDSTKTITNGVPVATTYTSSQVFTNSSIPTLSTAAFTFVGLVQNITAATQTPETQLIAVTWNSGSVLDTPSAWINQRYWLPVAISATANNKVLVYDRRQQWQRFDGIDMVSATMFGGDLLFSNTLGTFQAESGNDDDDANIVSYYTSPVFSPSGTYLTKKFNYLYVSMENSDETLTATYQVDDVNTDYDLADYVMNTRSGLNTVKMPFKATQVQQGKNIRFKYSVTGNNFWRLLGSVLDYTPDPVPQ